MSEGLQLGLQPLVSRAASNDGRVANDELPTYSSLSTNVELLSDLL